MWGPLGGLCTKECANSGCTMSAATTVVPVAEARAGLFRTPRRFHEDARAEPLVIGSRRRPEAVIVPHSDLGRTDPEALWSTVTTAFAELAVAVTAQEVRHVLLFRTIGILPAPP